MAQNRLKIKSFETGAVIISNTVISFPLKVGYGESCLVGQGVVLRIGGCPVPIPLGAQPGFGNQPHYEVPGDL